MEKVGWLYGEGVDDVCTYGGSWLYGEGQGGRSGIFYLLPIFLVYSDSRVKVEQAKLCKRTKIPPGKEM